MAKDSLIKSSSLVFLGIIIVNVFTYLFQITMGRMVSVQTFGEMNALLSVMVIIGVPFTSIMNYMAKRISHYHALKRDEEINHLIVKSYRNLLGWGLIITISGVFFSKSIAEYLKIKEVAPILLLLLGIFISIIIPINLGILQGFQMFKIFSVLSAGSIFLRYIVCVALVAVGLGLNGIMIGIIISVLVTGYLSFLPVKNHIRPGITPAGMDGNDTIASAIPIVVANLSFAILTQLDIVLVKYFFMPHEAGVYSSAAVIAKTVMYLPGAIIIPFFPMVASKKAKGEVTLHLILKALFLTLLLSGVSALVFYLLPDAVVSIFFGNRYVSAVPLLGLFAIAMLPMAVVMIIMNYNLAKGGRYFAYVMFICSAIQIAGIVVFHDSLKDVLRVILYSGLFCMLVLFLLLAIEYYRVILYKRIVRHINLNGA
jgi:O-antigen/teichoic acid export membrane protein